MLWPSPAHGTLRLPNDDDNAIARLALSSSRNLFGPVYVTSTNSLWFCNEVSSRKYSFYIGAC